MLGIDLRSAKQAWSFASVGLLIWGFFVIRKTILMFVLAIMFAYLVVPLVRFLQARMTRNGRLPALLLLFVGVPLLVAGTGAILRRPVLNELASLQQEVRSAEFRNNLQQWSVLGIPVGEKLVDRQNLTHVQSELLHWLPEMRTMLSRVGRDLTNLFLVPILAFFMLKDGKDLSDAALGLYSGESSELGGEMRRSRLLRILNDAHVLIQEYMQALVMLCLSVLIVFSLALTAMHVRYALLLSLLATPLEFVPLVGPCVAAGMIVGVSEFNHFPHLSWIICFLIAYRIVQDYLLSPYLMKRSVQLHPLLILFGVFAGGEVGGIGGIFLSVPMLAVGRLVFYEYRKQRKPFAESDDEVPTFRGHVTHIEAG